MGDAEDKQAEIDRKKAEVRARLEAQAAGKKSKKGFMTPERKKKLRLLLRKKAAEELKKEQERKAAERRKVIDERCGLPKDIENASEDQLKQICKDYFDRMYLCESQKYDMEFEVRKRDFEINELNIAVNDLRGKFIKPTLKKVSKYENKFAKLQKKAAEFNFRNQLKTVKKKEFTMDEEQDGAEGAAEGEAAAWVENGTANPPFFLRCSYYLLLVLHLSCDWFYGFPTLDKVREDFSTLVASLGFFQPKLFKIWRVSILF